jgi:phenylacetic acid degradation operon negative regulatory protein
MSPNPRALILRLVLGTESQGGGTLAVRELLASCALFGLAENTVRVALARAVAAGLLVAPQRGVYALGPKARPLADEVHRWRQMPAQLVPWDGGWIAVHVGAAGRSDRAALRARERSFGVLGLAEFERGLHLRPDNLAGGADALRTRLHALLPGGTDGGTVFALRSLSATDDARARKLWDTAALSAGYRTSTAHVSAWLDDARTLPLERAAREVFELGDRAIRQLVFDPWLPAPLVDDAARQRCVAAVARHDDVGQAIWRQYLTAVRTRATLRTTPALPRARTRTTTQETLR